VLLGGFTVTRGFARLVDMAPSAKNFPKKFDVDNTPAIASRDNRWLKRFRAALSGERDADGMIGVEGVRMVEAALGSRLAVDALLVSDSGARHLERLAPLLAEGARILRTSDRLFAGVADTQSPQGIAALVQLPVATMEQLAQPGTLIVALVGVQDPGNVGTIVRAADAFGASGVAACNAGRLGTADPFGPKALRASAGSALRLPIVRGISATALIDKLHSARVKIYAAVAPTDARDSKPAGRENASLPPSAPWDFDWTAASAILIGNEGAGLPAEIVSAADALVYVPQSASSALVGIESLNAAMAASVLLYEAMRQRRKAR